MPTATPEQPSVSYLASHIDADKPHWMETHEGFRIYKDVPFARTGVQQYKGHELKKHRNYDPAWGLNDDETYDVHRPKEEVTSPDTVSSFEGKSVTDGHPPGNWLHTYTDGDYSRGHIQNVRVGEPQDDGETPLVGDLHVKSSHLNDKIDGGLRDVSAGYTYALHKDDDGQLVQRGITGNHVAVVPKGRAGADIAIIDSAPAEAPVQKVAPTPKREEKRMSDKKRSWKGWALKTLASATDAEPEDVEEVSNMIAKHDADKQDDEPTVVKKGGGTEKPNAAGDDGEEAMPAWAQAIMQRLDKLEASSSSPVGDEDEDEDDKDKRKDKAEADDAEELPAEALPKSVLPMDEPMGDSADFLKKIKPIIAKSNDKALQSSYRKHVKRLDGARAAAADAAYTEVLQELTQPRTGAERDAPVNMMDYFNGGTYADGLKRYNDAMAKKGTR